MPARATVSLLAAPAPAPTPIQHPCLFFLYPPPALFPLRSPASFPRAAISLQRRRHNAFPRSNIRRPFHSTAARHDDAIDNARNHYETLKVPPTASASEIKKYGMPALTHSLPHPLLRFRFFLPCTKNRPPNQRPPDPSTISPRRTTPTSTRRPAAARPRSGSCG